MPRRNQTAGIHPAGRGGLGTGRGRHGNGAERHCGRTTGLRQSRKAGRATRREQRGCGEQKGRQSNAAEQQVSQQSRKAGRATRRRTTGFAAEQKAGRATRQNNGVAAAPGVPMWEQGRRCIFCYIFSGALKPRMLMHISKTFSVRVISATSDRRVVLSSSAKIFLSW